MKIVFAVSSKCNAFERRGNVGTRVLECGPFVAALTTAVGTFDFAGQRTPGHGVVPLPSDACRMVSAGVALRMEGGDGNYVMRKWRGIPTLFLRRERADAIPDEVSVIVFTVEAYLADPQVREDHEETRRIEGSQATHVVVAVLATKGPHRQLSPRRFLAKVAAEDVTVLQLIAMAADVGAYSRDWIGVAD